MYPFVSSSYPCSCSFFSGRQRERPNPSDLATCSLTLRACPDYNGLMNPSPFGRLFETGRLLFMLLLMSFFFLLFADVEAGVRGNESPSLLTTVPSNEAYNKPRRNPIRISKESSRNQRHMRRLYDDLFADYEREIRPVANDSMPLTVVIQFWLKQILKIDERDQTIKCYLWLELYWTDELLKWNPSDYGGLDRMHVPSTKIWRPDILVYNNANMNIEDNEVETNAIIKANGDVTLFRAMITDITCTLSLSLFPFDQQVCYLTFASWSMDGSKMLLFPSNSSDNLELYIRNTEWELTDFSVKMYEKRYECCPYAFPDITYFMVLKRSPSYYIFTLIIPSTFITVVTIVGFFTPHSTTGENTEKVSLGVNALLSMSIIMMMVSGEVPATSEVIPLIGKYYIGLIFLIFGAAFTTTITLAYQMRGNSGTPMSARMKHLLFEKLAKSPLGYWFFAVQIDRKNKYSNRPKGGPRSKENHTYIFDNVCIPSENNVNSDGLNSVHVNSTNTPNINANGLKLKHRVIKKDSKKTKLIQMDEIGKEQNEVDKNPLTEATETLINGHSFWTNRLYECMSKIDESISRTHQQRVIEFEWEQGTRIIERIIMIFYVTLTLGFAFFMLGGSGEDIRLTEEVMDRVKR
ncbi:unnamed protein product [Bursaphelenchus xylophilus]|uniref:(pine wood nematode) hypothetical protein n=1 Tax=Bursaphelenchus xylophilus TaxID=6326 RepID=A0A811LWT5_BURXY|nr:unnamed protein product [Bursaphelenchus xylophilus]CAG9122656.1 unnamed protein product [Bursaphelenchus xylophilus]